MSLLNVGVVVLLLLVTFTRQGSAQDILCSRDIECGNTFNEDSVRDCCVREGVLSHMIEGEEVCLLCYVYGWVEDIAPDNELASPQSVITADEGETIILNIFHTKNGRSPPGGFTFNIEAGGNATSNEDYTLPGTSFILFREPEPVNITLKKDGVANEGLETITLTLIQMSGPVDDRIILGYNTAVIHIRDIDIETGFRANEITLLEGNSGTMCLNTVGTVFSDTVINVTLIEGSAGAGDLTLNTQQVTLTAVNPEPCISFTAVADDLGLEGQEILTLSLSGPSNIMFQNVSLTVIIDDGDVVVFEFSDRDKDGSEETGVINVRVVQSVATAVPITLTITPTEYSDDFGFDVPDFDPNSPNIATPGEDYITDVITVVVPAGNGPTEVPIRIVDDEIKENFEQNFVGVLGISGDSTGAQIGATNATLLIIVDDENLIIQFVESSHNVEEGDTDFTYNLVLNKSRESEETYTLRIEGISDTAGDEDFSIPSSSVVFPPTASTINVSVTIIGDRRIELTEQFSVSVSKPGFLPTATVDTVATINIEDNDGNYTYVPDRSFYFVMEGNTQDVRFVLLNPPPAGEEFEFDFNVILSTLDIEAKAGEDYVEIPGTTLSGTAAPNGTLTITVEAIDDAVVELVEVFAIVGRVLGENIPVVFSDLLRISINIDDVAVISYEEAAYNVVEGRTVDVCLSPVSEELEAVITLRLSTEDGSAVEGIDYMAEDRFVIFRPNISDFGSGSGLAMEGRCITIVAERDGNFESDGSFSVVAEATRNGQLVSFENNSTTVTVVDGTVVVEQEFPGTVILTAEGEDGFVQICVVVTRGTLSDDARISLVTSDVTAREGLDYFGGSYSLTLRPGEGRVCANVSIIDDELIENAERFTATISSEEDFVIINNPTATVEIDGELATIGFEMAEYRTSESAGSVSVCVTVRDTATLDYDLAVYIDLLPSSATEGEDFRFPSDPPVINILSGMDRGCLTIEIIGSAVVEGEERINLEINETSTMAVVEDRQTTVVIESDGIIRIGFDMTVYEVAEGGTLNLVIRKSGPVDSAITFRVFSAGFIDEQRTFAAGVGAPNTITISMDVGPDNNIGLEPDVVHVLTLSLVNGDSQIVVSPSQANVTIIDDDSPVTVGFDVAAITVSEGDNVEVAVTLQRDVAVPVTVDISAVSGSAVEQRDFFITGTSFFTFSGNGTQGFSVAIVDDDEVEGVESFTITLTNPQPDGGVLLNPDIITITIVDTDVVTIGFDMTDYEVMEGGTVDLVVQKSGYIDSVITVQVFIPGLLDEQRTFEAGFEAPDNVTIPLSVPDDGIALEPDEVHVVTLSLVTSPDRIVLSPSEANVTVIDDDDRPVTVGFNVAAITVSEGDNVRVAVTLQQDVAVPVTVDVNAISGTAVELQDFFRTGISSFTFSGSGTQVFPVGIVDDDEVEGDESFTITLTNPRPDGVVLNPDRMIITIRANDRGPENITLVNNTIVGDPFYTVPVDIAGFGGSIDTSLCYEVHGEAGGILNLINDFCTLVNAHYVQPHIGVDINVIDSVAVQAVDSANECSQIQMNLGGCSVRVNDSEILTNIPYERNGISVRRYSNRVRVAVPNCEKNVIVMWVLCESGSLRNPDTGVDITTEMIKFVVARGISISEVAHGLLGQFWNTPINVTMYTGDRGYIDPNDRAYYLSITSSSSVTRTFVGVLQERTWDKTRTPCIYAGNRQAGPIGDIPEDEVPNDSVIEGTYEDYIVSTPFGNDCSFCNLFDATRCSSSG